MEKGRNYLSFVLLILIFALSACTQSPDFELYEGKSLRIAVVGEPPEVKEEQVTFNEISFDSLTGEEIGSYDAIFITEENLPQASESNYANIYLESTIPFFFISANSLIPFTEKETEFNKSWSWTAGISYAVGVITSKEDKSSKSWGFGLYNDKKTDENIKEVYSRIFETIEGLSH
ncbi:hypothetical protein [Bacillus sp. S/N-304-OC-R1]|uniref:hypothetical protein n=1 Tax=Bacillus sp. S/N-304-OC-R1 TaxID=2758034 RepID=UPI001C8E722C|nr:hypothetical protein [Bacillus sp. S/N-304-OC-R1]MBY0121602.1 hypothetical protein [Bacillus sp. S/N-304-OC-R1]